MRGVYDRGNELSVGFDARRFPAKVDLILEWRRKIYPLDRVTGIALEPQKRLPSRNHIAIRQSKPSWGFRVITSDKHQSGGEQKVDWTFHRICQRSCHRATSPEMRCSPLYGLRLAAKPPADFFSPGFCCRFFNPLEFGRGTHINKARRSALGGFPVRHLLAASPGKKRLPYLTFHQDMLFLTEGQHRDLAVIWHLVFDYGTGT